MKYFVALGFFIPLFFASCSEVNDCHCTIKSATGTVTSEYYDYQGACVELEDEGEVSCVAL